MKKVIFGIAIMLFSSCITTYRFNNITNNDFDGRIIYSKKNHIDSNNSKPNDIYIHGKKHYSKKTDFHNDNYNAKLLFCGFININYQWIGEYIIDKKSHPFVYYYNFIRPINFDSTGNKTVVAFSKVVQNNMNLEFVKGISTDPIKASEDFYRVIYNEHNYIVKFNSIINNDYINLRNCPSDLLISILNEDDTCIAEIFTINQLLDAYRIYEQEKSKYIDMVAVISVITKTAIQSF